MTDHAAKARETLEILNNGSWTNEQIHAIAGPAQVHATLALAEEQRTANLLATLALHARSGRGLPSGLAETVDARLGLTPATPNQEQNR